MLLAIYSKDMKSYAHTELYSEISFIQWPSLFHQTGRNHDIFQYSNEQAIAVYSYNKHFATIKRNKLEDTKLEDM